ncbi:MAG: alpha-D-glucose phosphate-specific phosphoglucomutase [Gammaproteobacteria bacterium]|nr:alpha-D-glucose phosphate-specific phosphoglucomutase [Gammaproteobacteria bacterium]
MTVHPQAGYPLAPHELVDVAHLVSAYYTGAPDPGVPGERVAFGTSGHRGSAFARSFNEAHILAITQAICEYRHAQSITGPLYLGMDTHALSTPAHATALEVLAANRVTVMIAADDEYTPTPAVSHAILTYNRERSSGFSDGILITPSHNPPQDGGFKYNPPHGGPAGTDVTTWIEQRANHLLSDLATVRRIPLARALGCATTHRHDYLHAYVKDLASAIDFDAIRGADVVFGVDPLGGAGVHYWPLIAELHGIKLDVVNTLVDPTFRFLPRDWDGQLRMDPSSRYVMQGLIALQSKFEVAFACDADHDRHGIVTRSAGLLPPNHYLAVAVDYLLTHRPHWPRSAAIGKTLVSSSMLDRVTAKHGREIYEVPVGFKWFVEGLHHGTLAFGGEESAGAAFLRRDGRVWTTDKDGILLNLLAAEMTATTGRDPGALYRTLTAEFGAPCYDRIDAPASPAQKDRLKKLSPAAVAQRELAGAPITQILTQAPGNQEAIGGLKVVTADGWFAARPSGTENVYKIYAESFRDARHLREIQDEAQTLITSAIGTD